MIQDIVGKKTTIIGDAVISCQDTGMCVGFWSLEVRERVRRTDLVIPVVGCETCEEVSNSEAYEEVQNAHHVDQAFHT